jgi:hypothetical protein
MTTTETHNPDTPGRVRVWFEAAIRDESRLPEAITRPVAYRDIWAHARHGAWTTRDEHSAMRIPATMWAATAIVCTGAGELVKWTLDPDGKPWVAVHTPRTPAQIWAHARTSTWATSDSRVKQHCATARAVAATTTAAVIDLVAWTFQRFTRFATITTATVLIGTAVAEIPIVGDLVPTLINITAW